VLRLDGELEWLGLAVVEVEDHAGFAQLLELLSEEVVLFGVHLVHWDCVLGVLIV